MFNVQKGSLFSIEIKWFFLRFLRDSPASLFEKFYAFGCSVHVAMLTLLIVRLLGSFAFGKEHHCKKWGQ